MTVNGERMNKAKISDKSQKLITFMGYWWVSFSVIFGIVQLSQFAFSYTIDIWWLGLILVMAILVLSTIISCLLLKFFPHILDKIFDKLPEEKKYIDLSEEEKSAALKAIIYSSLSNCENDETLLTPLKILCDENAKNDDVLQAIRVGIINSPIFHRLGKSKVRAINGVYTLFALEKAEERRLVEHGEACYIRNYVLINDLGWEISRLSDDEYTEFKDYIISQNLSKLLVRNYGFDLGNIQKTLAINNIEKAKKELEENGSHEPLRAQALRHLLNIDDNYYVEDNLREFNKIISEIKNDDDRKEMQGNACYLRAVHAISHLSDNGTEQANEKFFCDALQYIQAAQRYYMSLSTIDNERISKCYNVKGKLFYKYSMVIQSLTTKKEYLNKALVEFENGLKESKRLLRYDQILRNLLSLTEIYGNDKLDTCDKGESISYAKEGLKIAETLKNYTYKTKFLKYYKPRHIIIIRHGESEKNINKIVNGEGKLTQFGRETITDRTQMIKNYLDNYGYKNISIYGHKKCQVSETIDIIKSILPIPEDRCRKDVDALRPTDMGKLKGVSESNEECKNYLLTLERWRNGAISVENMVKELQAEEVESFWARAENFIESIKNDSQVECAIVVCTTSVAILLTHYLTMINYTSERYRHIDVPLGGIIHFVETTDKNKYEIVNKESLTNINFAGIE